MAANFEGSRGRIWQFIVVLRVLHTEMAANFEGSRGRIWRFMVV